jgi:hypothetical protein
MAAKSSGVNGSRLAPLVLQGPKPVDMVFNP